MALHDTDKTSSDRSTPRPNSPDLRLQQLAHGTTSFNPTSSGSDPTVVAAGSGTLRVVWQISDEIIIPSGTGAVLKLYTHNLNAIPFIFATGLQLYDNQDHYVASINDNVSTYAGITITNHDKNSFFVGYDDMNIGPGFDTAYFILFKAALFL